MASSNNFKQWHLARIASMPRHTDDAASALATARSSGDATQCQGEVTEKDLTRGKSWAKIATPVVQFFHNTIKRTSRITCASFSFRFMFPSQHQISVIQSAKILTKEWRSITFHSSTKSLAETFSLGRLDGDIGGQLSWWVLSVQEISMMSLVSPSESFLFESFKSILVR